MERKRQTKRLREAKLSVSHGAAFLAFLSSQAAVQAVMNKQQQQQQQQQEKTRMYICVPLEVSWSAFQSFTQAIALSHVLTAVPDKAQVECKQGETRLVSAAKRVLYLSRNMSQQQQEQQQQEEVADQDTPTTAEAIIRTHYDPTGYFALKNRVCKVLRVVEKVVFGQAQVPVTILVLDRPLHGAIHKPYQQYLDSKVLSMDWPYDYGFQELPSCRKISWVHGYQRTRHNQTQRWRSSPRLQEILQTRSNTSRQELRSFLLQHPQLYRAGIPLPFRARAWAILLGVDVAKVHDQYVAELRQRYFPQQQQVNYDLIQQHFKAVDVTQLQGWIKTIQHDLGRTMGSHRLFRGTESVGQQALFDILVTFCLQHPKIGYCQSMSMLASTCFLIMRNVEDAYWAFRGVLTLVLPDNYYGSGLLAARVDVATLDTLAGRTVPKLIGRMQTLLGPGAGLDMIGFKCCMTLFVTSLPMETVCRVWDCLLVEGAQLTVLVLLAMVKTAEKTLLASSDILFFEACGNVGIDCYDADTLLAKAHSYTQTLTAAQIRARDEHSIRFAQEAREMEQFLAARKASKQHVRSKLALAQQQDAMDQKQSLPEQPQSQDTADPESVKPGATATAATSASALGRRSRASSAATISNRLQLAHLYNEAFRVAQQSHEHESQQRLQPALKALTTAIGHFLQAVKLEDSERNKTLTRKRINEMLQHAEQLKQHVQQTPQDDPDPRPPLLQTLDIQTAPGTGGTAEDAAMDVVTLEQASFFLARALELDTWNTFDSQDDYVEISLAPDEGQETDALEAKSTATDLLGYQTELLSATPSTTSVPAVEDVKTVQFTAMERAVLALDGYEQSVELYLDCLRSLRAARMRNVLPSPVTLTRAASEGWNFVEYVSVSEPEDRQLPAIGVATTTATTTATAVHPLDNPRLYLQQLTSQQIRSRVSAVLRRIEVLKDTPEYAEFQTLLLA